MQIEELLEAVMVVCFGLSWPMSIIKSYKSRTAKGKSLFFLMMIWVGYVAGVVWKVIAWSKTGVFTYPSVFYIINLIMVSIDIYLYFVNRARDRKENKW